MYHVALRLVEQDWGRPSEIADGLGVILLTWNNAAYRYGTFDFAVLEHFLAEQAGRLEAFRRRSIHSFDEGADTEDVTAVFDGALAALITKEQRRSPVAVAKALHVMAPAFFPLWDRKIARKEGYRWPDSRAAGTRYLAFMAHVKGTVIALENAYRDTDHILPSAADLAEALSRRGGRPKALLKFLDEYYYARHTQGLDLTLAAVLCGFDARAARALCLPLFSAATR